MVKLKVRSLFTNIRTNKGIEGRKVLELWSLNCLQKSIAFTPFCPNAGPIGGDGVAPPAAMVSFSSVSLTAPAAFFDDILAALVRMQVNQASTKKIPLLALLIDALNPNSPSSTL